MGVSTRANTLPTAPSRTVLAPAPGLLFHETDGVFGAGHDGLGERQQQLPVEGEFHVAAVALEEPRAEIALQPADLPAECGLGGMDGARGAAEAARFGDREKGFEQVEFHLYDIVILPARNEKLGRMACLCGIVGIM